MRYYTKSDIGKTGWDGAGSGVLWRASVNTVMKMWVPWKQGISWPD